MIDLEQIDGLELIEDFNTNSSILFFSVSTNPENTYIGEIFGNEDGVLKKIFEIEHNIKNESNKTTIIGIDGIEFEFTNRLLNKNANLYIIHFEVKNLKNNLTRIKSIFNSIYLNKFIINHIIYGKKGRNSIYFDLSESRTTYSEGTIIEKIPIENIINKISGGRDIWYNWTEDKYNTYQYDEYLAWIHSYNENFRNKKTLEN